MQSLTLMEKGYRKPQRAHAEHPQQHLQSSQMKNPPPSHMTQTRLNDSKTLQRVIIQLRHILNLGVPVLEKRFRVLTHLIASFP